LFASLLMLQACGGGGSDTPSDSAPVTYPTSGAYGWTLKASGDTAALMQGLSLVHSSLPDNEYVIESPSKSITDTRLVSSGVVNPSSLTATSIQPYALLYIFGGDVRSVPLRADGTSPKSQVKRTNTSSACRFVLSAFDYAVPTNSRFIVSTASSGHCNEAQDGHAEVRFSADMGLSFTVIQGDFPLEVARDPVTLAPRGWIYPRQVVLWNTSPSATLTLREPGKAALTDVVASTYQSALVDDADQLSVFNFSAGNSFIEVLLNANLTAGGGWSLIGFDADSFYVYKNPGNAFVSPWTVLRITRANPTASVVAHGTGSVQVVSMGKDVLYLTVLTASNNHLLRINKSAGDGAFNDDAPTAIDVVTTVQTSANDKHLQWAVTAVGTPNASYEIRMVDEAGTTLYIAPNGHTINPVEASVQNFNASESRTRFIFAQGYGARAFSDASLVGYDTSNPTATVLGTLPGSAEFGSDFVFATAVGGPGNFGVGFATRSSAGNYMDQDARVFSFDLGTPSSMKTTTRRQ
ncbi:MAG TPA: hypothetical protein VE029_07465, partial [Rhizobacter sp.]|nr:hypothetical protein [Rhizobacter sp.]